ncbi:hypothetical protein H072_6747 [Dactylellina haptotyla CBS 200.50]|uniref:Uncharacterized protein n=1 Tax=Dactylellina haptotyla (strain CBS 200.50) TaxID=1284197 RepID=S8A9I7_DACHA|nr:hypothetical protein H072_6747 [Dactylellina haptotyla CBS 200.50]
MEYTQSLPPPRWTAMAPHLGGGVSATDMAELTNYKTFKRKSVRGFWGHPTVTISVWNSNEECWLPCEAEDIKLILGKKKLKLAKFVRPKRDQDSSNQNGDHISLASLQLKASSSRNKINAFLQLLPAPPQLAKKRTIEKHKPIFYFEITDEGQLARLQEDETPAEFSEGTLRTLTELDIVRKYAKENRCPPSQATWIRLESKNMPVTHNTVIGNLLAKDSRYNILEEFRLPCNGGPAFLSGRNQNLVEGMNGDIDVLPHESAAPGNFDLDSINDELVTPVSGLAIAGSSPPQNPIPGKIASVEPEDLLCQDRYLETPKGRFINAGVGVSGNRGDQTHIPRTSVRLPAMSKAGLLEEEQSIKAKLADIERELELLREKRILLKKLEDIQVRKASLEADPMSLLD